MIRVSSNSKNDKYKVAGESATFLIGAAMSILNTIQQHLVEYREPWKNRKIKSPFSNRMIMIGSLPFDQQEKFRPKELNATDDELSAKYDVRHKYVFDFYISVPREFETVEDYMNQHNNILATIDPADIIKYFDDKNYVIKLKNVPIQAVDKYFTLNKENDNYDQAEFKEVDKSDPKKAFDFVKFNEYHIFLISPEKYKNDITVINDTPDNKSGFVDKRKKDGEGVLETIRKENRKLLKEKLCSKK